MKNLEEIKIVHFIKKCVPLLALFLFSCGDEYKNMRYRSANIQSSNQQGQSGETPRPKPEPVSKEPDTENVIPQSKLAWDAVTTQSDETFKVLEVE